MKSQSKDKDEEHLSLQFISLMTSKNNLGYPLLTG